MAWKYYSSLTGERLPQVFAEKDLAVINLEVCGWVKVAEHDSVFRDSTKKDEDTIFVLYEFGTLPVPRRW